MAKIIGYKKQENIQYQGICDMCGAIIVFDEDELKWSSVLSSGICPNCNNVVFIDNKLDKYQN